MLFKTYSAAVFGIDAYLVEVEVDVGPGQAGIFNVVGLPDNAVRESREQRDALRAQRQPEAGRLDVAALVDSSVRVEQGRADAKPGVRSVGAGRRGAGTFEQRLGSQLHAGRV